MRKKSYKLMTLVSSVFTVGMLAVGMTGISASECYAAETEKNEYGYQVVLEDDADLLTAEEEEELLKIMTKVSEYGNVAFKSIDENDRSTAAYIERYYHDRFRQESGTVFLIDMDNRNIWIFSDGTLYDTITMSYANTITDNVYTYASDGDYYKCAHKAYSQMLSLLRGEKIAQPMKYISNAILAVILAMLIHFVIVNCASGIKKVSDRELLNYVKWHCQYTTPEAEFIRETKTYHPQSSGSSGGSRGGHSGGGGGHSGGGGGHRF